jgi:hypothetical protein
MPLLKSTSTTIYSPVQTYVYSRTLRTCLFIDLNHSLSLRDFFCFVLFCCAGEFDIFATAKAASSPSLTLLFLLLLLLLLPFTTRNTYKHSQMSSPSTRLLPIA